MMKDMRSRLVGHELTPKLVAHAFPEGLEGLEPGLRSAIHSGIEEQITTARFIHPNQIRVLELLDVKGEFVTPNEDQQRRANRFLLAVFSMSGKNSPRCRKLIHRIEVELGKDEVEMIHQEIDDAIYDLSPLTRAWL